MKCYQPLIKSTLAVKISIYHLFHQSERVLRSEKLKLQAALMWKLSIFRDRAELPCRLAVSLETGFCGRLQSIGAWVERKVVIG